MKSGKPFVAAALVLTGALAVRGDLQIWVQHLPADRLAPFFRTVSMPGGDVEVRRPPAESRAALSDAIAKAPNVAEYYSLRAHEDELALDFVAAESDWNSYARRHANRVHGYTALADYYHRREQSAKEIAALDVVAAAKLDPVAPVTEQPAYLAVGRILSIVDTEGLPASIAVAALDRWNTLHPDNPDGAHRAVEYLIAHKQFDAAQRAIQNYEHQFPQDLAYVVQHRAALETARGSVDKALKIYDAAFDPLWPADLTTPWFALLQSEGRLRDFLAATRTALHNNPTDLNATARLFDYWMHQQNAEEARRALVSFQLAAGPPKAIDLWTIGQLFERLPDLDEAARNEYALYSLPGVSDADAERALAALAGLLLDHSGDSIAFGSGDLSFYRDIEQTDRSPGFLNGILSLVLNSASPTREYRMQDEKSAAYFRRASGDRLVALLQTRFPKSVQLPPLRASLVRAYAAYADNDAVIRSGREYLAAYPNGAELVDVSMLLADSLAAEHRETEEFALYDMLLQRLATNALHVPLGEAKRSPDYARVLDRYLARLSELQRPLDALRVYRTEIDRNPNDPGLYRQFALYLDHNKLATQVIETYRRAMARFPDRSWQQALARWYLREARTDDFARLTREVVGVFSGSELETYFNQIVAQAAPDAQMYLQLNLYAHQRFPEDLQFVRNLLSAYRRAETANDAAYQDLLRRYWYDDANLRREYMADLAARGELARDIEQVRGANTNPAAVQFTAEAQAWLSHFEEAAPAFRATAEASPGAKDDTLRAASIYRSLAAFDPADTGVAFDLVQLAYRSMPRDRNLLATEGDIYADRDQLAKARPIWNSMTRVEPGKPDSYLDAATVFWDYYLFNDALRTIDTARRKFANPELYAYQEGAIYQGRRDYQAAVAQYAAGAVKGDTQAEQRLLRLAKRKDVGAFVDRATAASVSDSAGQKLRIQVLEVQDRRDELETFLTSLLNRASSPSLAGDVATAAQRDGFPLLEERAMEKQAALTTDPVDRMRLEIELVRFFESRKEPDKARETMNALYRANPLVLGVVRAAVDFENRQGQPDRAIEILQAAAVAARPDLANRFVLEAAQKANAAGEFDRARALLAGLLKADPFKAEYLAAMGATYRTDDTAFERFTLATVKALQQSPLPADQRTGRIVNLRRELIPVLTRNGDFAGAVEQYIESINRYPEDDALTREAAAYAVAHVRVDQLRAFYSKTIHDAPRDYRWPIVLARVETTAVDFPAAISDYDLAMKDRPDRADLAEARATLEERILRFEDAIKTYKKLYELTYDQPSWMEKIAELEARLGHDADAVRDIRTAIVGDRRETAPLLLEVAARLDQWNLVPQALSYAQRAAVLDAEDLPASYWRILARGRKIDFAGELKDTDGVVASAAGPVVAAEYTPEEKERLASIIGAHWDWLQFAQVAGLVPLQATILADQATTPGPMTTFDQLQLQRGMFSELGAQMEQFASQPSALDSIIPLGFATSAYIAEGDRANAVRVLSGIVDDDRLPQPLRDWYLATLSRSAPEELVVLAGKSHNDAVRNGAVQHAIANDTPELALRAVAARGRDENTLWTRAFTALTGVYFLDPARTVNSAFASALGSDATVGERLKSPVDRTRELAGNVWFYYGARYGEYLGDLHRAEAPQFLPARLELMPGNPDAYVELGDWYEAADQVSRATERYQEALQLNPDRVDAFDHMARLLVNHGNRSQALVEWRAAVAALVRLQSRGVAVPETFWNDATEMLADIGKAGALDDLKPDLTRWLTDYAHRNGGYRFDPLLLGLFGATLDAHESLDWVFNLAVETTGIATGGAAFNTFADDARLTPDQKILLHRRHVEVLVKQAALQHGAEQSNLESQVAAEREHLVSVLLDFGRTTEAAAAWALLRDQDRASDVTDQVRVAAATGQMAALLEQYRKAAAQAPQFDQLQSAVKALEDDGRHGDALTLSDFLYRRELEAQNLVPANFLGLAAVQLERKQNNNAIALLKRMNLVAGDPFETFVPAAQLLVKYGLQADAIGFLRNRTQAVPWDADATLQLAKLLAGAERTSLLNRVVADVHAPYKFRTEAAQLLAPTAAPVLPQSIPADSELAALARGSVSADAAQKPYRVAARMARSLFREALAITPTDATIRVAAIRSALNAHRDSVAVSLMEGAEDGSITPPEDDEAPAAMPQGTVRPEWREQWTPSLLQAPVALLDSARLSNADQVTLLEQISKAAERIDDLRDAILFERTAVSVVPKAAKPDHARLDALTAEQTRREANIARQPAIGKSIEQINLVRPKLTLRSSK